MPIFEYICKNCGVKFELLTREGLTPSCPSCKSSSLEKKFSVFAVHTKTKTTPPSCAEACPGFTQGSCGSERCSSE